jgi:hypothetical protein
MPDSFHRWVQNARRNWRINFDGFVSLSNSDEGAESQRAYVQVFRSGTVEAVAASIATQNKFVNILNIDQMIVHHVHLYSGALHECGIEPPLAVMASLIGLDQLRLTTGKPKEGEIADRDQLQLVEAILEEVPTTRHECAAILRPMMDQLANAAGFVSAQSFDDANNYLF